MINTIKSTTYVDCAPIVRLHNPFQVVGLRIAKNMIRRNRKQRNSAGKCPVQVHLDGRSKFVQYRTRKDTAGKPLDTFANEVIHRRELSQRRIYNNNRT
jgi:hypothetical protein